jgi:heat shock protein HtpX
VIRFALSRRREYLADAGAVELTKNPGALISALQKISGHSQIPDVPPDFNEMMIENPKMGIMELFATHPPIAKRIEVLSSFGGAAHVSQQVVNPWG